MRHALNTLLLLLFRCYFNNDTVQDNVTYSRCFVGESVMLVGGDKDSELKRAFKISLPEYIIIYNVIL